VTYLKKIIHFLKLVLPVDFYLISRQVNRKTSPSIRTGHSRSYESEYSFGLEGELFRYTLKDQRRQANYRPTLKSGTSGGRAIKYPTRLGAPLENLGFCASCLFEVA
jgi:hypothetical protein